MGTLSQLITAQDYSEIEKISRAVFYRYCSRSHDVQLELDDLKHYGVIGLLEARKKFDSSKGVWLPFMKLRVRGAMLDEIRKSAPVGQMDYQKIKQLEEARQELKKAGVAPSDQLLSQRLGWSLSEVTSWRRQLPVLVPALDSEHFDDDEMSTGIVLTSGEIGPEETTLRHEMWRVVDECLSLLPSPDLRIILKSRTLHGTKLKALAASFACTMENIRVKQKKAASWMRDCILGKGWPEQGWQDALDSEGEDR
ncbi:MAG: sigma-70 family RNA polymerase sigma factor [Geopsychrobacter sp.]|nr:sigma-70 family RNA polymerase sigma factor [Geopsychrobacter sp.]